MSTTADFLCKDKIEFYNDCILNPNKPFIIFGYASLITVPNFKYSNRKVGFIKDYATRLYQGSISVGTIEWPGRVATLVRSNGNLCFGEAFYVLSDLEKRESWEYLLARETNYSIIETNFYPLLNENTLLSSNFETVVTFVALPNNNQYLGECEMELQAYQILKASNKWPNTRYVDNLLTFYKKIPHEIQTDNYLKELKEILEKISKNEIILTDIQLKQLPKKFVT